MVSTFLFLFVPSQLSPSVIGLIELSSAITIKLMRPISCYHMTSFNYDDKKVNDVSLTCRCHLNNIMPDSIFHGKMRSGITCFAFICFINAVVLLLFWMFVCLSSLSFTGSYFCFLWMKEIESVFSL